MGLDRSNFSPRVQQRVVHAGVNGASFQQASLDLAEMSDLKIAPKPIERMVKKIGRERTDQRDAAVATHQRLPLMSKDDANPRHSRPSVAMVSVDGGRLQIREGASVPKKKPSQDSEPAPRQDSEQDSHWRESKVSVLETYLSDVHEFDPDPDVPRCFLDLKRARELVRGLGHALPVCMEFGLEDKARKQEEAKAKRRCRVARPGRPKRLVRSVLATRKRSSDFGPMVHQAAWERNFHRAERRAFLGDGLPANWTIQSRHFTSFTAILDFVHALSYVFAAAYAGRSQAKGAEDYKRWIQAAWVGQVATILSELEERSAELGMPPKECVDSDPRKLVFEALRYLKNNKERMQYDEYRRQGLPIMTSAVESAIKMINRRVKGTEKFWSQPGAEAILQLRADYLSETDTMSRFWLERENQSGVSHPYRQTA